MTPLKILIAEDNPDDAALLLRALRRAGFEPEGPRVDNEEDFSRALEAGPDLVLSDYSMPQFTGMRALEIVKARHPDIPFIIVSGTIGEETAVESMRLGAADYLLKDRLVRLGPAVTRALDDARLRRERRHMEADFKLLFAQNPMPMWVYACDTLRFLAVNDAAITHYGYTRDEFLAMNLKDIRPPEEVPRLLESLRNRPPGVIRPGIWPHRKKDGSLTMVETTAHRTTFQGIPAELVLANDVTHRLAAEKALRESESRLRTVTETAGIGLVMVDASHRYSYSNQTYARLLELPPGDLVGRPVAEILGPLYETEVKRRLQLAFAGERMAFELQRVTPRGTRHYAVTYEPATLSGAITHVVVVLTDVTELRQSDQRVREHLNELLRWQEVMMEREGRVQALKAEVNALLAGQNLPPRYGADAAP